MFAFVVCAALCGPARFAGADDEGWKPIGEKEGVVYEKRAVPGSKYFEHRARLTIPLPPDQVMAALWDNITGKDLPPTTKSRKVLKQSPDEVVVYDEIAAPVVKDRDVTLRLWKRKLEGGAQALRFEATTEYGPPPDPRYVRLTAVRGAWILVPADGGKATHATYVCYSEPGGSIPASFVRGAQEEQVPRDVHRLLKRLGFR
jgi:hypothetical protein